MGSEFRVQAVWRKAWRRFVGAVAAGGCMVGVMAADDVAVVFNEDGGPDSRMTAEHYATKRAVPPTHVIGLSMSAQESFRRAEFRGQLLDPLRDELEKRGLMQFRTEIVPANEQRPGAVVRVPVASKIRYLVLCPGVPLRILHDDKLVESGIGSNVPPVLRFNGAAVDNELAALPVMDRMPLVAGPISNLAYRQTNMAALDPVHGVLMVARLDGPGGSMARALVDRAIEAETQGLWGRAYFDMRGLTNGPYMMGEAWIRRGWWAARRQGFEVVLDDKEATFSRGFPMPQIALYAGWYNGSPSGPFLAKNVDFMPGAIAYHLYSFSARTLRKPTAWVPALIEKGVTATVGYTDEPLLPMTIDIDAWFCRMLDDGATFGEATYAALPTLSWHATVVGDPLYRPAAGWSAKPREPGPSRRSEDQDWALLRRLNQRLFQGGSLADLARDLEAAPSSRSSPILQQKLGDVAWEEGDRPRGMTAYRAALELKPTAPQRMHLELVLARRLAETGDLEGSLEMYERFFKHNPGYLDLLGANREALAVAQKSGRNGLIAKYHTEVVRLTPKPSASTNAPAPRHP